MSRSRAHHEEELEPEGREGAGAAAPPGRRDMDMVLPF